MSDRPRRRLLICLVCALGWLFAPGVGWATHRGEDVADEVAIQMSYQAPAVSGALGQVVARIVVDDGSPVAGIEVEFLREIDFLGSRLIRLGRTTTDAYGAARMTIDVDAPTVRVRVRFAGDDHYLAAEAATEVSLPVAPAPTTAPAGADEPSLAIVAAVMPPVLAATALAVWLSLLGLTAATLLAIRRGRRPA